MSDPTHDEFKDAVSLVDQTWGDSHTFDAVAAIERYVAFLEAKLNPPMQMYQIVNVDGDDVVMLVDCANHASLQADIDALVEVARAGKVVATCDADPEMASCDDPCEDGCTMLPLVKALANDRVQRLLEEGK